jgi:predicted transcriptional regulator of viral defense system
MTSFQERFFEIPDENAWDVFTIGMLKQTELSSAEITQALRHFAKSGSIVRIERGKYRRKNITVFI